MSSGNYKQAVVNEISRSQTINMLHYNGIWKMRVHGALEPRPIVSLPLSPKTKRNKTTPHYGSSVLSRCSQEHRAASPNGSQSRTAVSPQEGEVPALFLLSFVLKKLYLRQENLRDLEFHPAPTRRSEALYQVWQAKKTVSQS